MKKLTEPMSKPDVNVEFESGEDKPMNLKINGLKEIASQNRKPQKV